MSDMNYLRQDDPNGCYDFLTYDNDRRKYLFKLIRNWKNRPYRTTDEDILELLVWSLELDEPFAKKILNEYNEADKGV